MTLRAWGISSVNGKRIYELFYVIQYFISYYQFNVVCYIIIKTIKVGIIYVKLVH